MAEEIIKSQIEDTGNEIVVDDGVKKIIIRNTVGEQTGTFYFNPTDIGILSRYKEVAGKFDTITEPLVQANISTNGEGEDDESVEALGEAQKRLYELCDYLFGGNLSEAFFEKVNPFSPVNGKFYCENALEAVGNYISKAFSTEVAKINNRVDKYTHGVRTGKHKNGRK